MEVLRQGNPPDEEEFIGTCRLCECKVKFKRKEAKEIPGDRSWESSSLGVDCPTQGCKGTIYGAPAEPSGYYMDR